MLRSKKFNSLTNILYFLVSSTLQHLGSGKPDGCIVGGSAPLSYTQVRLACERIRKDTGFSEPITPRRFRTTVLTDLYEQTKDIKLVQKAAGHTTANMTLKYYVKGRAMDNMAAVAISSAYGLM